MNAVKNRALGGSFRSPRKSRGYSLAPGGGPMNGNLVKNLLCKLV